MGGSLGSIKSTIGWITDDNTSERNSPVGITIANAKVLKTHNYNIKSLNDR